MNIRDSEIMAQKLGEHGYIETVTIDISDHTAAAPQGRGVGCGLPRLRIWAGSNRYHAMSSSRASCCAADSPCHW